MSSEWFMLLPSIWVEDMEPLVTKDEKEVEEYQKSFRYDEDYTVISRVSDASLAPPGRIGQDANITHTSNSDIESVSTIDGDSPMRSAGLL
jgi:hypothetical protein